MWLRACDLSLYDGNVNDSFWRHRNTNCDDPEEEKWIQDMFTAACDVTIRKSNLSLLFFNLTVSYQYFLCTWLFLSRLSTCSTTSSLLASRRAPDISFSSPRQVSSWESDLIFIPAIILERTGSTEEMDVTPEPSERQQQQTIMYLGPGDLTFLLISNNVCCTVALHLIPTLQCMELPS